MLEPHLKFSIVILSYNQAEQTGECIKSIQAVKPREFPDKQIFVVHNGSDPAVVNDLRQRYPRFHHVVLNENEGFCSGANAGIRAGFSLQPWVLFLTQDTTLVHFPKSSPFEPCLAAVKVFKRKVDTINSIGGAADLELAKHYYCTKAENFWDAFESSQLQPFVPRTAFWIHQTPFEKVNGFDENMGSIWEDVDFSLRIRKEGEMLQLDETTEVIHHRKGLCRRDPIYTRFLYNRNRFAVSRNALRSRGQRIFFEMGIFLDWLSLLVRILIKKPNEAGLVFKAYRQSFVWPLAPTVTAIEKAEPAATPKTAAKTPAESTKTNTKIQDLTHTEKENAASPSDAGDD